MPKHRGNLPQMTGVEQSLQDYAFGREKGKSLEPFLGKTHLATIVSNGNGRGCDESCDLRRAFLIFRHRESLPQMTDSGQSLWDPCMRNKGRLSSPFIYLRISRGGAEEPPAHRTRHKINLRRALRVEHTDTWNILGLSENH